MYLKANQTLHIWEESQVKLVNIVKELNYRSTVGFC